MQDVSDDWLEELLTCHRAHRTDSTIASGAGSSAPGSHHGNVPEACSSARHGGCTVTDCLSEVGLSASHGCRTVRDGLWEACSSASHIAHCGSTASDDLLEELSFAQRAPHEHHSHDKEDPEDDWLEELLSCHRAHRTDFTAAVGAGSSAPGSHHSNVPEACSSARHGGCTVTDCLLEAGSSASHGCRTVRDGLSKVCASVSQIAHCSSKTEARRVFISEAKSLGTLPSVCIPEQVDVVLWNLMHDAMVNRSGVSNPLMWGRQRLAAWFCAMGPAIFKCGIAADPVGRYFNLEYGYVVEDRWHFMDVFWQGPANPCRQVEIDFISDTQGVEGCCNESRGGEGVHPDRTHQCYVYLVMASVGHGISLKRSRHLRAAGGR